MLERTNRAVLKTVVPQGTGGSNPPPAAYAPIAQWIEYGFAEPKIEVQILVGAQ